MPIYNYRCKDRDCGHIETDVLILNVQNEESEKPTCLVCNQEMEKFIGGSYLIKYNTEGFYQTDYNKKDSQ